MKDILGLFGSWMKSLNHFFWYALWRTASYFATRNRRRYPLIRPPSADAKRGAESGADVRAYLKSELDEIRRTPVFNAQTIITDPAMDEFHISPAPKGDRAPFFIMLEIKDGMDASQGIPIPNNHYLPIMVTFSPARTLKNRYRMNIVVMYDLMPSYKGMLAANTRYKPDMALVHREVVASFGLDHIRTELDDLHETGITALNRLDVVTIRSYIYQPGSVQPGKNLFERLALWVTDARLSDAQPARTESMQHVGFEAVILNKGFRPESIDAPVSQGLRDEFIRIRMGAPGTLARFHPVSSL